MSEWTEARDARLRALWEEGHSGSRIAEALGVTKNAVMGRAYRLNLTKRASPIAGDGAARPPKPPGNRRQVWPVATNPSAVLPARREAVQLLPRAGGSPHRTCQWIEGEPAGAATRFCGAPRAAPGCSWCAAHAARVFVVERAA